MIRFFWKYRFFNLIIILLSFIFCILNFNSIKVFFDSERIIELANVERDIIDKSLDDKNLLLAGIELDKALSFTEALKIASILTKLDSSNYVIRSIRSVFNEQVLINQSIPIPIKLLHLDNQENFSNSLERIKKYESNFISSDFKSLVFVIKCKNLDSEIEKIKLLDYLHNQLSALSLKEINITGQIKSEIYMKTNIIKELILFISLSFVICSIVLSTFLETISLFLFAFFYTAFDYFSFSLSNIMFGGIELVMIIIPAIIFIINISDYMHLLNIKKDITSKYRLFCTQLINIGKPVFLLR